MRSVRFLLCALCTLASGCGGAQARSATPTPRVTPQPGATIVRASEVDWQPLNPARGDASPMAATVFGDRNGTPATGFLFHAEDGFESPPHIHNVSYRAVVIRGLVHNDDAAAEPMWMPAGSFWTQPRGAAHITAVSGPDSLAYVEIDEGPYLVRPVEQAFETDEAPVNVDASNIVWVNASELGMGGRDVGVRLAFLWGRPEAGALAGMFVSVPAGEATVLAAGESALQAIVIGGEAHTPAQDGTDATLDPGSYVRAEAPVRFACGAASTCVMYVRTEGALSVLPSAP